MGNTCTSSKPINHRQRSSSIFFQSKTQKIAYHGDKNGISPVSLDIMQMSTMNGLNSAKEIQSQKQVQQDSYITVSTPVSGQAYKNYIKIQINNIPVTLQSPFSQSKFSSQPNTSTTQDDEGLYINSSVPSRLNSRCQSSEIKLFGQSEIRRRMQQYFIDQGDSDIDITSSKCNKKKENILKDFTKRERGIWQGPTQNSLFDAFYLAYTLNEDLVLNPHDIWDQILITLKLFYQQNNIHSNDIFPKKKIPKESKVINYKEMPNPKNKNKFISWDQILKQIQQHNSDILQTFNKESLNNQDNPLNSTFKIKRISQLVYNQLIYLSNNSSSSESTSYLPYQIFPGYQYQLRNIVFRSSLSDWVLLREKILSLFEVAPEFWIERLYFIVDNFIDTLQGKLNHAFWNQGFLMKSNDFQDEELWKFGWMKELFSIDLSNNELYRPGIVYTCKNIPNYLVQSPYIFKIQEHKINIDMNLKAHKSCLISPKNLPNSFEPLLTMYLTSSMKQPS